MQILFVIVGMVSNILKNVPFVGPVYEHWLNVLMEGATLTNITKAIVLLGVSIGLVVGISLLILTKGGVWEIFVLFIKQMFIPAIFPGSMPKVDTVEALEAWSSSWDRFFSRIKKILMGFGVLYLVGGFLAFILYIIIALPDLISALIKFIVKEAVPLILESLTSLFLSENGPFGFLVCAFNPDGCPDKEEAVKKQCMSELEKEDINPVPVKERWSICQTDKLANNNSYSEEGARKCEDHDDDDDDEKELKNNLSTFTQCMKRVDAKDSDEFSKIMSGETSAFGAIDEATGFNSTEIMGNVLGKPEDVSNAANDEGFTNWV